MRSGYHRTEPALPGECAITRRHLRFDHITLDIEINLPAKPDTGDAGAGGKGCALGCLAAQPAPQWRGNNGEQHWPPNGLDTDVEALVAFRGLRIAQRAVITLDLLDVRDPPGDRSAADRYIKRADHCGKAKTIAVDEAMFVDFAHALMRPSAIAKTVRDSSGGMRRGLRKSAAAKAVSAKVAGASRGRSPRARPVKPNPIPTTAVASASRPGRAGWR